MRNSPKATKSETKMLLSSPHINPLTTNVTHHIGTSKLIYNANQLTGFYMTRNIGHSSVN